LTPEVIPVCPAENVFKILRWKPPSHEGVWTALEPPATFPLTNW
jgi:hypothetical protein